MEAGRLRHSVEIQAPTTTYGADNSPTHTFATVATRKGWIRPLSTKEALAARAQGATFTHACTMRYYSGLTPKHQLKYDGRIFHLDSVLNVGERNFDHELICKEVEV